MNNVRKSIKKTGLPQRVHDAWNNTNGVYLSTFRLQNGTYRHFVYDRSGTGFMYRYISNDKNHAKGNLQDGTHSQAQITVSHSSSVPGITSTDTFDVVPNRDEFYISYQDENDVVYGIITNSFGANLNFDFCARGYMIIRSTDSTYTNFEVVKFVPLATGAMDTPQPTLTRFNNAWYIIVRKRGAPDYGSGPFTLQDETDFGISDWQFYNTIWVDRRSLRILKSPTLTGTYVDITPAIFDPLNSIEGPHGKFKDKAFVELEIKEQFYGATVVPFSTGALFIVDSFFQNKNRIVPAEGNPDSLKGTGEEYPTFWFWKNGDLPKRIYDADNDPYRTIAPNGLDTDVVNGMEIGSNTTVLNGFRRTWYTPDPVEQAQLNEFSQAFYQLNEFGQLKISSVVDTGDSYLVYWVHRIDTHYRDVGSYKDNYSSYVTDMENAIISKHGSSWQRKLPDGTLVNTDSPNAKRKPSFVYVSEIPKRRFASWENAGSSAWIKTKPIVIDQYVDHIAIDAEGTFTITVTSDGVSTVIAQNLSINSESFILDMPSHNNTVEIQFDIISGQVYGFRFMRSVDSPDPEPTVDIVASGGNEVYDLDGYRYHKFTSNGTFTVTTAPSGSNVEYLVVGAGGAGGYSAGRNGGGAGGEVKTGSVAISPSTNNIVVGGITQPIPNSPAQGASSSALGITALGGGGTSSSAGGAVGNFFGGVNNGLAAGGGGASFVANGGDAHSSSIGGNGANGLQVWGTYCGGGGGGASNSSTNPAGQGGLGGGGNGRGDNSISGQDGQLNTGGGGGGSRGDTNPGGKGGSGIVIIRYPLTGGGGGGTEEPIVIVSPSEGGNLSFNSGDIVFGHIVGVERYQIAFYVGGNDVTPFISPTRGSDFIDTNTNLVTVPISSSAQLSAYIGSTIKFAIRTFLPNVGEYTTLRSINLQI